MSRHRHGDSGTYEMMCDQCERSRHRFEVGVEWFVTILLVSICAAIVWRFTT